MDREQLIDYLYLRAEECGYSTEDLIPIGERLKALDQKDLDTLRRISEPAFRNWCKNKGQEI